MDSIPNRKRIRILKGKPKRVCRSVDRPCARSTGSNPRAAPCQLVDRAFDRSLPRSTGRSTGLTLCTSCTPVDRAVDREHILACSMRRLAPLSSDLYATFFHLLYLLSPYNGQPRQMELNGDGAFS